MERVCDTNVGVDSQSGQDKSKVVHDGYPR